MNFLKPCLLLLVLHFITIDAVPEWQDLQCQVFYVLVNTFVKLRSRSRSGTGQVRVRKVRVRSETCELKDLNKYLRTWT